MTAPVSREATALSEHVRGPYDRDLDYAAPPRWSQLYAKYFPEHTDPWSRHAKLIADDILRNKFSPVRRLLIDAGYEPDHWATALEATVVGLWKARSRIAELENPVTRKRRRQRQLTRILRSLEGKG